MNKNFDKMIEEFLSSKDENELNKKIEELEKIYDFDAYEKELDLEEKANKLLDKAENAKSKEEAIKYAKKAYKICQSCFEAVLFLSELELDNKKKMKILNKGLAKEKERITKEGYFEKENIGNFYTIFETRQYIMGLFAKLDCLIINNKMKEAISIAQEIIYLNNNDNMGARFYLIAIYSYLNDLDNVLQIYKKYNENRIDMLFPLFLIYYKLKNYKEANKYLKKINKYNKYFIEFFKETIVPEKDIEFGSYIIGSSSEIIMYFYKFGFLLKDVEGIKDYILNQKTNKS